MANHTEQTDTSFSGTNLVLTYSPSFVFGVYVNGVRRTQGVDYTLSLNQITFTDPLLSDSVSVVYNH